LELLELIQTHGVELDCIGTIMRVVRHGGNNSIFMDSMDFMYHKTIAHTTKSHPSLEVEKDLCSRSFWRAWGNSLSRLK
jgi:hypothetical protein